MLRRMMFAFRLSRGPAWFLGFALSSAGLISATAAILDEKTEQIYAINATANVTVRNTDGRIFVFGSDATELKVTALKRAFSKERLDRIQIDVAIDGEEVTIETTYPPAANGSILADRSGTVDYLILLPQTCTLLAELARGEVVVEGMRGSGVEARLSTGRILVRNCFTPTRVTLGHGGLDLFYDWWEGTAFSVEADVSEGDLRVGLPLEAGVRLDAASVHGAVRNHLREGEEDRRAVQLTLGDEPRASFRLRTTRGTIKLEKAY